MSGGTKVALVALMVLMMVVIARLVDDESADGLGGGTPAGAPEGDGKNNDDSGAAAGKVATPEPPARSLPTDTGTPKGKDIQLSANPSRRTTQVGRPNDPRRVAPRGSGSSRSSTARPVGRPATPSPRAGQRTAPSAVPSPGPISGDPTTGLGAEASRGEGGLRTTRVAPVSVAGSTGSTSATGAQNPLELARAAAQQNAVVTTQLGASGAEPGPGTGARRLETSRSNPVGSGTSRTQLAPRTRTGTDTGSVRLKEFNVSKRPTTSRRDDSPATSALATGFPVEYIIQPNDSLWKIAAKYYGGRGHLYPHIQKRNPNLKMHPGKTLIIPAPPPPAKKSSEPSRVATRSDVRRYGNVPTGTTGARRSSTARMHTVRKGETLWEIAGRAYGDPTQYVRIKNANPHLKNADDVKAGTKILIP